jgi:hypothetical protein
MSMSEIAESVDVFNSNKNQQSCKIILIPLEACDRIKNLQSTIFIHLGYEQIKQPENLYRMVDKQLIDELKLIYLVSEGIEDLTFVRNDISKYDIFLLNSILKINFSSIRQCQHYITDQSLSNSLNNSILNGTVFTSDEEIVKKNSRIQNEKEYVVLSEFLLTKTVNMSYGIILENYTDIEIWSDLKTQEETNEVKELSLLNLRKRTMKLETIGDGQIEQKKDLDFEKDNELTCYL